MIISEAEIKSPLTLVDNTEKIKELKEEAKELKEFADNIHNSFIVAVDIFYKKRKPKLVQHISEVFLKLIKQLSFEYLKFVKLYTETYDIRDNHIKILEAHEFILTSTLIKNKPIRKEQINVLFHSLYNKQNSENKIHKEIIN